MKRIWQIGLLAALIAAVSSLHAQPLPQARQLLDQGEAEQAYELLKGEAKNQEGRPEFDFLYGMAALQSGHPAEASFAFERILFAQPQNHRVRLELARAYFQMGNYDIAKGHFEAVLRTDPPSAVKQNIQKFLVAIETREAQNQSKLSGYVDQRFGWDSNIRSATDLNFIDIGGFSFAIDDSSQETADAFSQTVGKLKYTHQLGPASGYFLSVKADVKENINKNYDTLAGVFSGGPIFQLNKQDRLRIPLIHEVLQLDGDGFRKITGAALEWTRTRPNNRYTGYLNANAIRYDEQSVRDVDLLLGGFANVRSVTNSADTKWYYNLFVGKEFEKQTGADHLARTFYGAKLGVERNIAKAHTWYASLTAQSAEYNGTDPVFLEVREDTFVRASLGWSWQFAKQWDTYLAADFSDNNSNIDLYDYDRTQYYAGIRWRY